MSRKRFYIREYNEDPRCKSFSAMTDQEIKDYYIRAKNNNHFLSMQRLISFLNKADKMDIIDDI